MVYISFHYECCLHTACIAVQHSEAARQAQGSTEGSLIFTSMGITLQVCPSHTARWNVFLFVYSFWYS